MVFAILLILPAAIFGALHIISNATILSFMLSPSAMLLAVVAFYIFYKKRGNCCDGHQRLQPQTELTSLPATTVEGQAATATMTHENLNATYGVAAGIAQDELKHKDTDALLDE